MTHDEDLLEQLYWEFDAARAKSGEERLRFKGFMRAYATKCATAPVQEVVALEEPACADCCPYCEAILHPPAAQRQWVGLTDGERVELMRQVSHLTIGGLLATETKLKEKNT